MQVWQTMYTSGPGPQKFVMAEQNSSDNVGQIYLIKLSIKSLDSMLVSKLLSSCCSLDDATSRANRTIVNADLFAIMNA